MPGTQNENPPSNRVNRYETLVIIILAMVALATTVLLLIVLQPLGPPLVFLINTIVNLVVSLVTLAINTLTSLVQVLTIIVLTLFVVALRALPTEESFGADLKKLFDLLLFINNSRQTSRQRSPVEPSSATSGSGPGPGPISSSIITNNTSLASIATNPNPGWASWAKVLVSNSFSPTPPVVDDSSVNASTTPIVSSTHGGSTESVSVTASISEPASTTTSTTLQNMGWVQNLKKKTSEYVAQRVSQRMCKMVVDNAIATACHAHFGFFRLAICSGIGEEPMVFIGAFNCWFPSPWQPF